MSLGSSQRRRVLVAAGGALLAAGAGVALWRRSASPPADRLAGMLWPNPPRLAAFALTDQQGHEFGVQSLRGHWSLLFFGYTHCPDVCPTTLSVMAQLHRLRTATDQLRYVFVTIDPARDDRETLAAYVGYFSPDFIALRGSASALTPLTSRFGVVVLREPGSGDDYLLDHTAALFLVDPQARLVGVLQPPHDSADLSARIDAIRERVERGGDG